MPTYLRIGMVCLGLLASSCSVPVKVSAPPPPWRICAPNEDPSLTGCKKEGVNIFTVFFNPEDKIEYGKWIHDKEVHNKMLANYREQKWDEAVTLVNRLMPSFGGGMKHYYELWLERIEEMRNANLPKDWDGVFRATSK